MKYITKLLLLLHICYLNAQVDIPPLITSITLEKHSITYSINQDLKQQYLKDDFWVCYEDSIDLACLDYSIITMPLLLNIISIVWISGSNYSVEAMDYDLYHSLETIKAIFKRLYPQTTWNGNVIPKTLVYNNCIPSQHESPAPIALPFSHGLDSVCSSLRHRNTPQLLITVRGFNGTQKEEKWAQVQQLVEQFARTHKHTNAYIEANFYKFLHWEVLHTLSPEILHWRLYTMEGLSWAGIVAPLLVAKGIPTLLIAGNYDWNTPHPASSCPLIDSNLRFAGIRCIHDSFDITRPEKNKCIAELCATHDLEKPFILTCVYQNKLPLLQNCCRCQKCVITILSFLAIGQNHKEYGYDIAIEDFITHCKQMLANAQYPFHRIYWLKCLQQTPLDPRAADNEHVSALFEWLRSINFDALVQPNSLITIDYRNFVDVYPAIPTKLLTADPQPEEPAT